ncbi:MAG: hypothetical protein V1857_01790 [archaeon]
MVALVLLLAIAIGGFGGVQVGSVAFPRTAVTTSYTTSTTTSTFQTSYSYPIYVTVVTTTTETRFTYPYQQYPYPNPYPYPYPSTYPRATGVLTVTYVGATGASLTLQVRDSSSGAVLTNSAMYGNWFGSSHRGQVILEIGRLYVIAIVSGSSTLYSTQIQFTNTVHITLP